MVQTDDEFVDTESWEGSANLIISETESLIQSKIDPLIAKMNSLTKHLEKTQNDEKSTMREMRAMIKLSEDKIIA